MGTAEAGAREREDEGSALVGWLESVRLMMGITLVGQGLVQWSGWLRAERDPALMVRTRRVGALLVVLGLMVLAVHVVLVAA